MQRGEFVTREQRHSRRRNLTGQRFGNLVAIEAAGAAQNQGGRLYTMWRCRCDCGGETIARVSSLTGGNTKSCGCRPRGGSRRVHGESAGPKPTAEYQCWLGILRRCNDASRPDYPNYGGRGIRVCTRWQKFENFLADMGQRPDRDHSIDRINLNGNYEPSNCRWASRKEQNRNSRRNHMVTLRGETKCLAEWIERYGMATSTVEGRMRRGWSAERALTTPPQRR